MFMDIGNKMTDKIYVQIDSEIVEATGEVLEQILKDRENQKSVLEIQ